MPCCLLLRTLLQVRVVNVDCLDFTRGENEMQKIMSVFSTMFISYYSKFSYRVAQDFNGYCTQEMINCFSNKGIFIADLIKFKMFAYSFFYEIVNQIKQVNYSDLEKLYSRYNPVITQRIKRECETKLHSSMQIDGTAGKPEARSLTDYVKSYIGGFETFNQFCKFVASKNLQEKADVLKSDLMSWSCLKPIVATQERIINMVVDLNNIGFDYTLEDVKNYGVKQGETKLSSSPSIHSQRTNDSHEIDRESAFSSVSRGTNMSNQSQQQTEDHIPNICKKPVLCEMTQVQVNETELQYLQDITFKAEYLTDLILDREDSNTKVQFIRNFLCFIVEINSDLISLFPEFENVPENMNLRVIIAARNIYLVALEVYFSLNDLYDININTILELFKQKYLQLIYSTEKNHLELVENAIKFFYKLLTSCVLEQRDKKSPKEQNRQVQLEQLIESILVKLNQVWENEIITKGKELTKFVKT